METKKIQCPSCGVILEVRNSKLETMKIIDCPQCSVKLRVRFSQQADETIDAKTYIDGIDKGVKTILADIPPSSSSKAFIICDGNTYELYEGANIVGRKANSSTADVQLDVTDMYMSRLNAVINVRKSSGNLMVSIINYKNLNPIKVGDIVLLDGDEPLLDDGDEIIMGTTKMTIKIE